MILSVTPFLGSCSRRARHSSGVHGVRGRPGVAPGQEMPPRGSGGGPLQPNLRALAPGFSLRAFLLQGPLQRLLARNRDLFLRPSVRRDADGTYVVLLQSIDRAASSLALTPGHVEATIPAMGFTISPLKREYLPHRAAGASRGAPPARVAAAEASPESLVTLVLSLDLGGWLGAARLACLPRPLRDALSRVWVEALLMTVIALANKVRSFPRTHKLVSGGAPRTSAVAPFLADLARNRLRS